MRKGFWLPLGGVAVLALARLFPSSGLADASLGGTPPASLCLEKPFLYVVFSPFCEVLDHFAFLSRNQHLAMAASLSLPCLYLLLRRAWRKFPAGVPRRARRIFGSVFRGVFLFWTVYAWLLILCAFLPRPAVALRSADPDDIVVDLHSHTSASRDGLPWFDVPASRNWHRKMGFHAVYITDHDIVNAAWAARALNPARAGDDLVFLPGEELSLYKLHLVVLGNTGWIDPRPFDGSLEAVLSLLRELAVRKNVITIASLPEYNADSWGAVERYVAAGVDGFEMATGAPQSLDFPASRRARVRGLAERASLCLTAATDMHGYGHACLTWTVLHIPGWRRMSPSALDDAVRAVLRDGGPNGARPVIRDSLFPASSWKTPLVLPAFVWGLARSLTWGETISWLCWLGVAVIWSRRRKA